MTIAVTPDLSPDNDANLGNLKAISPEEPRHALIFAIARDIDNGMTDADLEQWKTVSLSTTLHFKKVEHEDEIFWHATNCREAVGAQFEVVYYSSVLAPAFKLFKCLCCLQTRIATLMMSRFTGARYTRIKVQRIFQLNAYKLNREMVTGAPMTAEMLAAEYSSKVRISSGETVSVTYAYSAISVYNLILKDDVARSLVLKAPPTIMSCGGGIVSHFDGRPHTHTHVSNACMFVG